MSNRLVARRYAKALAGIAEGQGLKLSWFHPMVIYTDSVPVSIEEPKVFDLFKVEAAGGRAHYLDGVSEPYNGGTRHARCAAAKAGYFIKKIGDCFKMVNAVTSPC